jgi:hypothetical protein
LIVIRRIGGKNSPQVHLAEDDHLIQTLAAQCADQTFRIAILPRRLRRDWSPNVTQANRDGVYRYPFSTNESGMSAFAKAPAVKSKSKSKSKAVVQPWELR